MPLVPLSPPAADPVTLAEIKQHLRVDHDEEDARIASFIGAAVARLDGRAGLLGRCLIAQSWRLVLARLPSEIALPLPPCLSVERIGYETTDGAEVDLDAGTYRVTGLGTLDGARVRPVRGPWPRADMAGGVFVEFTAGFGPDGADVPEPLRAAIAMHVAHLYAYRESVVAGSGFITETPHGYDDLIRDYRVWSF